MSVFSIATNFELIFFSRVCVGLFLSVFIIFFPVWIDSCAPPKSQSLWISFYFLTEELGIVVGYGVAIVCKEVLKTWTWSFIA